MIKPDQIYIAAELARIFACSEKAIRERWRGDHVVTIGMSRRWHGLTLLREVPGLAAPAEPVADGFTGRSSAFDKHELAALVRVHPASLVTHWERYAIRLGRLCRWSGESLTQQIPGLSDGRLPSGCNGEFARG